MRPSTSLLSVVVTIVLGCAPSSPPQSHPTTSTTSAVRVTEPFRKEHVELRRHLEHVHEMNGHLSTQSPPEQAQTMQQIVGFFEGHLAPHAKWEEGHLYESVDKRTGGTANRFTASMRYEHRVVERWLGDLRKEKDPQAFARKTDWLLGLVTAHFEAEEEVLLPVLDRTMTAEEFHRELGHHE
jgi:hemerythrin superfamily protein